MDDVWKFVDKALSGTRRGTFKRASSTSRRTHAARAPQLACPPGMASFAVPHNRHPLSAENAHRSYLQVDYPAIGLLNRILQIIIVVITAIQLFGERTWAYSEVPVGTVNAFVDQEMPLWSTQRRWRTSMSSPIATMTRTHSSTVRTLTTASQSAVTSYPSSTSSSPNGRLARLLASSLATSLASSLARAHAPTASTAATILVGSLATDACPARWMPRHGTTLSCAQTSAHHAPHRNHTRRLVIKGTQQVQFVTMFLENTFHGYPCSNPFINAINGTCEEGGGTVEFT